MSKNLVLRVFRMAMPATLLGVLVGCQTYNAQSSATADAWQSGNGVAAVEEVNRRAEAAAGSKDELLWRLEQGAILKSVGEVESSLAAFDQAEAIVNKYEEESKVRLGGRTASLLTNQAALPYRGRAYDKIMMNTYKALNYLALADNDNARIELNRALQRQRDAVAENQKRLEEATAAAEAGRKGELEGEEGKSAPSYDVDRAQEDPKFAAATGPVMAELDARLLPYADYVNPFAVFLDGIYFTHLGLDNADIERARKSLERVRSMSPGTFIEEDFQMAERMAMGEQADTVTYVILASGSAPERDQLRIDIPLFLVSSVSYVGASFPKLAYNDNYLPAVTAITSDGSAYDTELLCNMDSVISRDFKNEWPSVVTATLLTTATKAIAGKAIEDAVGDDWKSKLIAKAVNIGWQASTNNADLRTWKSLPKKFSYARIPTPQDGFLKLNIGYGNHDIQVEPGKTNLVFIRSINPGSAPIITNFALNKGI